MSDDALLVFVDWVLLDALQELDVEVGCLRVSSICWCCRPRDTRDCVALLTIANVATRLLFVKLVRLALNA